MGGVEGGVEKREREEGGKVERGGMEERGGMRDGCG